MKSDTPKVLHKISGKPMLYYSIKEALKLSDDITVVLYHQFEKVKTEIEKYFSNINFVIQDHKTILELVGLLWELLQNMRKF